MSAPICFVDTETDGIHPGRKPWEIALIRRDDIGERELSFFVQIDLSTANPYGLKIGRFYERHPLGRAISGQGTFTLSRPEDFGDVCPLRRAAELVAQFTHGAHLVGAVPNFDAEVFDRLLRENGLVPSWHYHLVDVEALALGYLRGQGQPAPSLPWKADELTAAIGVELATDEEKHTALGDARWAMRTYDVVMGHAEVDVEATL